ncbi:hypothetical protein BD626DRAFT_568621 [Schizophyllum amplum]|uniref:Zn(2)-C6 fungal-type domain-containing protein n=1 Tax=Schizophyllum amplum TaxID=97359 RepID=A0A550CGV3_9AGAR|nr:hypothetical protein BD626DRAFT_568621 [Auriculariopsis ampla]
MDRRRPLRGDEDDRDRDAGRDSHESSLPPTLQPLMFREPQPPRDSASRSTYEPRDEDEPHRDDSTYPASYPAPAPYTLRPAEPWDAHAHAQRHAQEVTRRYLPARGPVIDDAHEHAVPGYAIHPESHPVAGPSSIPHGSSTQYYSNPPVPVPEDPAYRAVRPPPPRAPTSETFDFYYNSPAHEQQYRERAMYRDEPPMPSSFRPADPMAPRRQERAPPMEYLRPYTGESGWERRDSRYMSSYAPPYPEPPPPMEEYGPSGAYAHHREPWQPEPDRYPPPPPPPASSSMPTPYRQYQEFEPPHRAPPPPPPPSHDTQHYPPDPYSHHYLSPADQQQIHRYDERSWAMDTSRHENYTPGPSSSQSVYSSHPRPDEDMEPPPPQKRARSVEPRKTQTRKTEIACDFCRGRKLRCDGQKPACSNCQQRSNVCTYRSSPRRRGPGKVSKAEKARRKAEKRSNRDAGRSSSSSSSHTTAASAYASGMLQPPYAYGYSSAYLPPPQSGPPLPPGPPPPSFVGPTPMTPVARRSVRGPTRPSYAEEPEEDEETERPEDRRGGGR